MINTDAEHLMMIEPAHATAEPLIDSLTRRVAAAWRTRKTSDYGYRGQHYSTAAYPEDGRHSPMSDNRDHWVGGMLTNSLIVHYVAHCRYQIPAEELAKLEALPLTEAEPTQEEIWPAGNTDWVSNAASVGPRRR